MKTNLEQVKKVAIQFLYLEPERVGEFGDLFVTHPFISTAFLYLIEEKQMFNLFQDKERFDKWKLEMKENINRQKELFAIFMFITNPYKLTFFKYVNEYLSEEDFAKTLINCYTQMEVIVDETNVTQKELVKWFEKANKTYLMDKKERKILEELPEKVTIYRGIRDEEYMKGFSWTLSKNKGIWFAKRFDTDNQILLETVIDKKDILCYTNERNEEEVIINPKKLNVENITKHIL